MKIASLHAWGVANPKGVYSLNNAGEIVAPFAIMRSVVPGIFWERVRGNRHRITIVRAGTYLSREDPAQFNGSLA